MLNEKNNTIVALSTPQGVGAICVVRMSGENAISVADKIFTSIKGEKPSQFQARRLELGTLKTEHFKDKILCVVFRAPFSFTGENLVEFQCHGGTKIAEGVIAECIKNGARLADSGEFSKRAFINGKMDLEMAEGMMDMINAQSDAEIRAGYNLLDGELGKIAKVSQQKLTDLLSDIEVSFDYPEEDIEFTTREKVNTKIAEIKSDIDNLIATSSAGKQISNGISCLILGEPNVGKSSLLNAIVGANRAIVTDIAGTTRDIIEVGFEFNGIKFNLIDTAGIHETQDLVETLGINKAKELIKSSDICLCVVDSSKPQNEKDKEILNLTKNHKRIIIGNKIDLTNEPQQNADIFVSTKNKSDIETLKNLIYKTTINENISSGVVITNLRHLDALTRASEHLKNAQNNNNLSLDLVSVDLNLAYSALGEITGSTTGEDILNAIFSKFCLGK